MVSRLLVQLSTLAAFVVTLGAQAPVGPTVGLVRQLYADVSCEAVMDEPRCPADRDLSLMSRAQLARYFDGRLLDLWLRDWECVTRRREICNLDFAPLWDSQDPAGTTVRVLAGDRANHVVVELRRPASTDVVRLQFELVRGAVGWRIRDVSKPTVWSLVALLSRRS